MNKPTIQILNDHVLVEFEQKPKLSEALDLVAPERFLIQEADSEGEHNAYAVTTDRRTINPQIVNVIQGTRGIPEGRYFVHYGAFEIAKWYSETQKIIPARMVFFKLEPIQMLEGNYLGEEIFIDGDKTDSGIYTTPYAEVKLPCNVRITYVPENSTIQVGDEVITIDSAQYTLKYEDKKYIKLRDTEIVAKVVDGEVIPLGKYILVGYDETELSPELVAEDDRKAFSKDFAIKNRLFVPDIDFEPTKAPKNVDARLLAIGDGVHPKQLEAVVGDMLLIARNAGVPLKGDKWIINLDSILFVYGS